MNKYKEKDYGKSVKMTAFEKKISFLNRYFVYKKVIMVNTEKVELDLGDYNDMDKQNNILDTVAAEQVAKKEVKKLKPTIKKLNKKLLLVNATEVMDEEPEPEPEQGEPLILEHDNELFELPTKDKKKKTKKAETKKTKKITIIDEEED